MRQCIFPDCKSRPNDRIGNVALVHRFPQQEHIRKQWVQWVKEKCGLSTFEFSSKAALCYRHFDRNCYHSSNGLLKPFSYPTFTPQDLDNLSLIGSSAREISKNGTPKTNLIIQLDPTLVKNSTTETSDKGKKFVLLVTDQGMEKSQIPNSSLPYITQDLSGIVRPQDIPPLRLIEKKRTPTVSELTLSNQDKSTPIIKSTFCLLPQQFPDGVRHVVPSPSGFTIQDRISVPNSCVEKQHSLPHSATDCQQGGKSSTRASVCRSPRTLNVIQTVLDSSRRRIRTYRRRLQQEKKKIGTLEKLLDEMKEKQLISIAVAKRFEAVLNDD